MTEISNSSNNDLTTYRPTGLTILGVLFVIATLLVSSSSPSASSSGESLPSPSSQQNGTGAQQSQQQQGVGNQTAQMGSNSSSSSGSSDQTSPQQQANGTAGQNGTTKTIAAGGEGPESVLTAYEPQNVTINAGETVVWTNPTVVGEPHTITFFIQPDYFPAPDSPFLIANGTELTPANPNEKNAEPFITPAQNDTITTSNTIIVNNKRFTLPVVIDAQNNVTCLPLNGNYTMTGDELYVNSGWMYAQGQIPPGVLPITSFSVTFANAGTYDYTCILHPWMAAEVVVK
jgi:plastocyanin